MEHGGIFTPSLKTVDSLAQRPIGGTPTDKEDFGTGAAVYFGFAHLVGQGILLKHALVHHALAHGPVLDDMPIFVMLIAVGQHDLTGKLSGISTR